MDPKQLDHYYRKAKDDGHVARSVYKLEAIDKKYKLFKKKQTVMDLGAAPGSWTSYVAEKVGDKGCVVALDLNPLNISTESHVSFYEQDIEELDCDYILNTYGQFDLVVSDMAPQTTGIKIRDHIISIELCLMALEAAKKVLKPKGQFVCKFFQGADEQELFTAAKKTFKYIKIFKPDASQKKSKEKYLIGLEYKL